MTENGWLSSAINSIIFLGNAFWFNAVLSKLLYFFKYLSHGRCRNTGRRQSFLAAPRNAACCSGCLFKWQIKLDVLKLLAVLDNSAEHSLQMVIFFFFWSLSEILKKAQTADIFPKYSIQCAWLMWMSNRSCDLHFFPVTRLTNYNLYRFHFVLGSI